MIYIIYFCCFLSILNVFLYCCVASGRRAGRAAHMPPVGLNRQKIERDGKSKTSIARVDRGHSSEENTFQNIAKQPIAKQCEALQRSRNNYKAKQDNSIQFEIISYTQCSTSYCVQCRRFGHNMKQNRLTLANTCELTQRLR